MSNDQPFASPSGGQPPQHGWGPSAQPQPPMNPYGSPTPPQPPYTQPGPGYPPAGQSQRHPQNFMPQQRPGIIPLRPLTLGDIFEAIFRAFRHNPLTLLLWALFGGLLQVLASSITIWLAASYFDIIDGSLGSDPTNPWALSSSAELLTGSISLITSAVAAIVNVLMLAAVAVIVDRSTLGLKTSLGQSFRLLKGSYWKLLGLSALIGATTFAVLFALVWVLIGFLWFAAELFSANSPETAILWIFLILATFALSIVIGLWLTTKLIAVLPAMAVEQIGPFAAIKRSWILTRQNFWRLLGIFLLLSIMMSIAVGIVTMPLTMLFSLGGGFLATDAQLDTAMTTQLILSQGLSTLVGSLGSVFLGIGTVLLYVDLRMRREGHGLALTEMAAELQPTEDSRFELAGGSVQTTTVDTDLVPGRSSTVKSTATTPAVAPPTPSAGSPLQQGSYDINGTPVRYPDTHSGHGQPPAPPQP